MVVLCSSSFVSCFLSFSFSISLFLFSLPLSLPPLSLSLSHPLPSSSSSSFLTFFLFFCRLGVHYYTFHDRDVAPEGQDLTETNKNLDVIVSLAKELQTQTGIKLLWGTANLFAHPVRERERAREREAHFRERERERERLTFERERERERERESGSLF